MWPISKKESFFHGKIKKSFLIAVLNFVIGFLVAWVLWSETFYYMLRMFR